MTAAESSKNPEDELLLQIKVLEDKVRLLESPLRRLMLWNYGQDGNRNPVKYLKSIVDEAEEALRQIDKSGTR